VSKSPAKKAAPSKKTAVKAGAAVKKAAAKKVVPAKKVPVKKVPAKKVPAKRASVKKAPTKNKAPAKKPASAVRKPAPRPAAKPAPKAMGKPQAKLLASPPAKATSKKNAPDPVTKTAPKSAATTSAAPAKPSKPVRETKASARAALSASMAMPEPAQASRFADRFAPMRHARPIAVDEPVRPAIKFDPKLVNAWKTKAGRDLTEPELLAMPDTEYMNEKQLEFFRVRLAALKDDLLSNAGETTEHLREDTSIVPDPADRATIEEEHALELRTRDRERKLLKKISQSLARIEASDYGYCDETGEPIGLARLLARPTATLSLEAQQRREMKQKMFGD
jgi:DnaK suppressor protein